MIFFRATDTPAERLLALPTLSFQNPLPDLAFAKPKALRLGAASYETPTWAKVLEEAARAMLDGARTRKAALAAAKRFPWMGRSGLGMARPCELEPGVWIELHQCSHGILVRTKMLLESCGYPLDWASLEYEIGSNSETESCKTRPRKKVRCPDEPTLVEPVQPDLFGLSAPEQPSLFHVNRSEGKSSSERIGEWARREFKAALSEGRIPDKDFDSLCTKEGTKVLLGMVPNCCPVFGHSPIVDKKGRNRCWKDDPATRNGKSVYVNSQWYDRDRSKLERLFARWSGPNHPTQKHEDAETNKAVPLNDMKRFLDDIREHWPEGFDFSDGALRLLEGRCGPLSGEMKKRLKSVMFRRRDKLWFPVDAVVPPAVRAEVIRKAQSLVENWGFASLPLFAREFDIPSAKLRDDADRSDFAQYVLRSEGFFWMNDHGDLLVFRPIKGDAETVERQWEDFTESFAGQFRDFVAAAGGNAVPSEDATAAFPNMDIDTLVSLMGRHAPDVIPEMDGENRVSFKRLDDYYLPDDFREAIQEALGKAKSNGVPPTSAFFAATLSERYRCNFTEDYALDPAYSLKWAIEATWLADCGDDVYFWEGEGARARFVPDGSDKPSETGSEPTASRRSLPDLVEENFSGVFTNDEFWRFSAGTYGLNDRREAQIAQLGYLAPRFARLDRDRWISIRDFREIAAWNEIKSAEMARTLSNALGSAPFLPISRLGASVLDALPSIPFRWTTELAASVSALLCPDVHVANHGAAPFAVTAFLAPRPVSPEEVVAFVLRIYAARNTHVKSVEGAFAFLKENNIRFRLTKNCRAEIERFLAKEVH